MVRTIVLSDGDDVVLNNALHPFRSTVDDDVIFAKLGDDFVDASKGNDTLYGNGGDDTLRGNVGDDLSDGGNGNDIFYNSSGNDTLIGGGGDDFVHTGGASLLYGDDPLHPGANGGDDTLIATRDGFGGPVSQALYGMDGNDRLVSIGGYDTLDGGRGNDFIATYAGGSFIVGGSGDDVINTDFGTSSRFSAQANIIYCDDPLHPGKGGDDRVSGGASDDIVYGEGGNDTLFGGLGSHTLRGGRGDDVLKNGYSFRADLEHLIGGAGADYFIGDASPTGDVSLVIEDLDFSEGDRFTFAFSFRPYRTKELVRFDTIDDVQKVIDAIKTPGDDLFLREDLIPVTITNHDVTIGGIRFEGLADQLLA